ncbi:MAG TPA: LON peptidase substrate-binding domain-containing protein, partial [Ktedonobacteraceae bacterium]|nr:LON peptidase substrate-binding domain-containing protein [Ktedonobacteraceae bacterium]
MEKKNTDLEHKEPVEEVQAAIDKAGQKPEMQAEAPGAKDDVSEPETGSFAYGEQIDNPADGLAPDEQSQSGSAQDEEERLTIPEVLPVLPLKDTVVYPLSLQPLGVGQERSKRLIDDVMRGDRLVVLVAQKSADMDHAGPDDIFKIGTVARVVRIFRMPDDTIQIAVQGLERVAIGAFTQEKPYLMAHVTLKPDTQEEDNETEAIKRNVIGYF